MIALIAMLAAFTEASKLTPPTPCYSSGSSLGALCTHHTAESFAAEAVARLRRALSDQRGRAPAGLVV